MDPAHRTAQDSAGATEPERVRFRIVACGPMNPGRGKNFRIQAARWIGAGAGCFF